MRAAGLLGVVLLAAGVFGLAHGWHSCAGSPPGSRPQTIARVGSLELVATSRQPVRVGVWAGLAAGLVGGLLVLTPARE